MTNTKQTTEERFDKTFSSEEIFSKGSINEGIVKTFIKQEQSRLLKEIVEKKGHMFVHGIRTNVEHVLVEDIQQIAKEWGIEISAIL